MKPLSIEAFKLGGAVPACTTADNHLPSHGRPAGDCVTFREYCHGLAVPALTACVCAQAKRAPHAAIEDTGFTAAFPVMSTKFGTWDTITAIDRIQPSIRPTSVAKIKEAKVLPGSK